MHRRLRRWWKQHRRQHPAQSYPPPPKRGAQPAGAPGEDHHRVYVFGRPRSRFPREVKVILVLLLLGLLLVLICPRMSRSTSSGQPFTTQRSGG